MQEKAPQPVQEMQLPDHQDRYDVYGHQIITEYEQDFAAAQTPEDQEKFQENMRDAREIMLAYSQDAELDEMTNSYFEGYTTLPPVFRQGKQAAEQENGTVLSWTGWLAEKADDQQVLNFLQWHNNEHETRKQSPEFKNSIETQKRQYADRVKRLKREGVLHEETLGDNQELAGINIELKDIFSYLTVPETGHFSDPDTGNIEMIEGYKPVTLWHELNHSVIGRLSEDGFDSKQWLNEAVTEHIARVMKDGGSQIVDPERRNAFDQGEYVAERKILHAVLNGGAVKISPNYLTKLYSARSESAKAEALKDLQAKFIEAYDDPDVLDKVTAQLAEVMAYSGGIRENGPEAAAVAAKIIENPAKALGLKGKAQVYGDKLRKEAAMSDSERAVSKIEKLRKDNWTDENIARAYKQWVLNGHEGARKEIKFALEYLDKSKNVKVS